jgi:DNA-binding MarR family transcriptional regulator
MVDLETIIARLVNVSTIDEAIVIWDHVVMTEAAAPSPPAADGAAPRRTPHGDAWGALARTHAEISGRLQEALAAADFPPLPWYEVLAAVAEAPKQQMKMGELADALAITRGGLTKLVDRLIRAGLMERALCATDRRVSYATLLPAGAELLAEMRPVVVAELRSAFAGSLSAAEARELRDTLERVRAGACSLS